MTRLIICFSHWEMRIEVRSRGEVVLSRGALPFNIQFTPSFHPVPSTFNTSTHDAVMIIWESGDIGENRRKKSQSWEGHLKCEDRARIGEAGFATSHAKRPEKPEEHWYKLTITSVMQVSEKKIVFGWTATDIRRQSFQQAAFLSAPAFCVFVSVAQKCSVLGVYSFSISLKVITKGSFWTWNCYESQGRTCSVYDPGHLSE